MKKPSKTTALLIAFSVGALLLPSLVNGAMPFPHVTAIHRIGQLFLLFLAFVLGCLILNRQGQSRIVGLAYAFGLNLVGLRTTLVVLIPGNEDMWKELVCWGFWWLCEPESGLVDLSDLLFAPSVWFGMAFLLTLCELGFLHLVGELRRRWVRGWGA